MARSRHMILEVVGFLFVLAGGSALDSADMRGPILVTAAGMLLMLAGLAWERWWNGGGGLT